MNLLVESLCRFICIVSASFSGLVAIPVGTLGWGGVCFRRGLLCCSWLRSCLLLDLLIRCLWLLTINRWYIGLGVSQAGICALCARWLLSRVNRGTFRCTAFL